MTEIGKGIGKKMSFLNTDVTEIPVCKGIAEKLSALMSKIHKNNNKITKDTPVEDLKAMWENEIKLAEEKEAA